MKQPGVRINRSILSLALPAILNNITVPLLGLCDTAISGHLGDAVYIAAIAVGATMLNVLYWLCGFLRMGTSGLTAQAYGASDARLISDILRKALLVSILTAILFIILQNPLCRLFLLIISPEPGVAHYAENYFYICIWAAPAQLGIMALSGWFIGLQNTFVPMAVAIGVNLLNILLSLLLVFLFNLGFTGIAVGTLCSSWCGFAALLLLACLRYRRFRGVGAVNGRLSWKSFFGVSSDLFFRSACIMAVTLAMTSVGARLGETVLAANSVMMQFFLFFSYFMDGFAFAAEALVGKAVGAADDALRRESVRGLFRWGGFMALLFLLLYFFFTGKITGLITDIEIVRETVMSMRWAVWLLPPITVTAFIFDGIFIGMARTRPLFLTTLLAASIFFLVAFAFEVKSKLPSNNVLWIAFECYLFLRGILLAIIYAKCHRKSLFL